MSGPVQGPGRHRSCVPDLGTSGGGRLQSSWTLGLDSTEIVWTHRSGSPVHLGKENCGFRSQKKDCGKLNVVDGCLRRPVVGVRWRTRWRDGVQSIFPYKPRVLSPLLVSKKLVCGRFHPVKWVEEPKMADWKISQIAA